MNYDLRNRSTSYWFILGRFTYVCEVANFRDLVYAIEEQNEGWFCSDRLIRHGTSQRRYFFYLPSRENFKIA